MIRTFPSITLNVQSIFCWVSRELGCESQPATKEVEKRWLMKLTMIIKQRNLNAVEDARSLETQKTAIFNLVDTNRFLIWRRNQRNFRLNLKIVGRRLRSATKVSSMTRSKNEAFNKQIIHFLPFIDTFIGSRKTSRVVLPEKRPF